jgi:hypothetical protein
MCTSEFDNFDDKKTKALLIAIPTVLAVSAGQMYSGFDPSSLKECIDNTRFEYHYCKFDTENMEEREGGPVRGHNRVLTATHSFTASDIPFFVGS